MPELDQKVTNIFAGKDDPFFLPILVRKRVGNYKLLMWVEDG